MKDFKLNPAFRQACQGDVQQYCGRFTKKYVPLSLIELYRRSGSGCLDIRMFLLCFRIRPKCWMAPDNTTGCFTYLHSNEQDITTLQHECHEIWLASNKHIPCESKKLHRFTFTVTLSNQALFWFFWHTCTSLNFLSQAYFIFFIKSKAENRLEFKQYSVPGQCVHTTVKLLHREMPDFIIAQTCGLLTPPTSVMLIAESWPSYRSGSVNILCETWISWGSIWLTDRWSLIKWLISGDSGWVMTRVGHFEYLT